MGDTTIPNGQPKRQDLVLPDARQQPMPAFAHYTLPEEFLDPKTNQPIGLSTKAPGSSMFDSIPDFFQAVLSGFGMVPKPRNVVSAATRPLDYFTGKTETEIAKRSFIPGYYMPDFTLMDEDWVTAQRGAAFGSMAVGYALEAWAGGKNTDGSGRTSYFLPPRDPFTGKRSMGSVQLNAIMASIYLVGGSLASQHRLLQGDGMSSTEAYFTAAFPPTGWPLTFFDKDHTFFDMIHADFLSSSISMLYNQYTGRMGGIVSILLYAGKLGTAHLTPALEDTLVLIRAKNFVDKASDLEKRWLARFDQEVSYPENAQAKTATAELKRLEGEIKTLNEKMVQLQNNIASNTDGHGKAKRGKAKEVAAWKDELKNVQALKESFENSKAVHKATLENPSPAFKRIERELSVVNDEVKRIQDSRATLLKQRALRPTDADVIERLGKVQEALDELDQYRVHIKGLQNQAMAGEKISFVRAATAADVRSLAGVPFAERRLFIFKGTPSGDAVDLLEHARNLAALPNGAQKEFLAQHQGAKWAPVRFAYGAGAAFMDGRWRIRAASYTGGVFVSYATNTLSYHYMWGFPWEKSFKSGASVFFSLAVNEPWIGALKAAGVQKIPTLLQYFPSASLMNLWWPVTRWDTDIMLMRCQEERSNLLHSLDPEYRAAVRGRIAHVYSLANKDEKDLWSKPLEDGGCGLPVPKAK